MNCPKCSQRMHHQGYFAWLCELCHYRCRGELPQAD